MNLTGLGLTLKTSFGFDLMSEEEEEMGADATAICWTDKIGCNCGTDEGVQVVVSLDELDVGVTLTVDTPAVGGTKAMVFSLFVSSSDGPLSKIESRLSKGSLLEAAELLGCVGSGNRNGDASLFGLSVTFPDPEADGPAGAVAGLALNPGPLSMLSWRLTPCDGKGRANLKASSLTGVTNGVDSGVASIAASGGDSNET